VVLSALGACSSDPDTRLRREAEGGDPESQFTLGVRYEDGIGVPQDITEAAIWIRRAADQDLAIAQTRLADLYAEGRGVPQDHEQAVSWYRRAAEQGDALAEYRLGFAY